MSITVYFVTGNKNKLQELQKILGNDVMVIPVSIDLCEFQGEFQGDYIVRKKLDLAIEYIQLHSQNTFKTDPANSYVMVEDTGLYFNALNGLPGPYIKCFVEKLGLSGIAELVNKYHDKTARCVCTIGIKNINNKKSELFQGIVTGTITNPQGPQTFGWDAIFVPDGTTKTFAQMCINEKNLKSHRYLACKKLKEFLININ